MPDTPSALAAAGSLSEFNFNSRTSGSNSLAAAANWGAIDLHGPHQGAQPNLPPLESGRWLYVNAVTSGLKAQLGYGFDLKVMAKRVAAAPVRHLMSRVTRAG